MLWDLLDRLLDLVDCFIADDGTPIEIKADILPSPSTQLTHNIGDGIRALYRLHGHRDHSQGSRYIAAFTYYTSSLNPLSGSAAPTQPYTVVPKDRQWIRPRHPHSSLNTVSSLTARCDTHLLIERQLGAGGGITPGDCQSGNPQNTTGCHRLGTSR